MSYKQESCGSKSPNFDKTVIATGGKKTRILGVPHHTVHISCVGLHSRERERERD